MKKALRFLIILMCLSLSACGANENAPEEASKPEQNSGEESLPEVDVKDLDYSAAALLIEKGGSYTIDKEIKGTVVVNTKDKLSLTLKNATIKSDIGPALYVVDCGGLTLNLEGENALSDGEKYSGSFAYAKGALAAEDDVTISGSGSLTVWGNYKHGIVCDDSLYLKSGNITIENALTDAIHANDLIELGDTHLTVKAAGSDGIECEAAINLKGGKIDISSTGDGIKASLKEGSELSCSLTVNGGDIRINTKEDGLQSDGDLTINGGTLNITTTGTVASNNQGGDFPGGQFPGGTRPERPGGSRPGRPGEDFSRPENMMPPDLEQTAATTAETDTATSSKGIKATGNLTIKGGDITVSSTDDSVHSNSTVIIENGSLKLSTDDDGIHADGDVSIKGGDISISKSYEGIEGKTVTVDGGRIELTAGDDGINASSGGGGMNRPGNANSENHITINGGELIIKAGGDGVDSNGALTFNGGFTVVDCASSGADSPIDADGVRLVNGGKLIAAGGMGMLENPSNSSKQCCIVITGLSISAGDNLYLKDGEGNTLLSYTAAHSASSLTLSAPEMKIGETYSLYKGNEKLKDITLTATVTQEGSSGGWGR